jgi:hypothetical protein
MSDNVIFQNMVERAMLMSGRTKMRPVIEKELFHYDILFALDRENLLDHIIILKSSIIVLKNWKVSLKENHS